MARYEFTDDRTGMRVELESETPPPVESLPEIFSQAQKRAQKLLSGGQYALGEDNAELTKEDKNKRIQKLSAQALGVSPDEIDVHSGMGGWARGRLESLPTPESRMEYLEKKYGEDGVGLLDIDGEPQMFYKDPKSGKMTMVNDRGFSLSDVTSFAVSQGAPIAGAVVGGVKGAATGAAVGSAVGGVGAIPGAVIGGVLGAAGGGFATGVAQDVASQAIAGQDVQFGEITGQRAKEALVGGVADVALLGAGKFVGRPLMRAIGKTTEAQGMMDAVSSLNQKFGGDLEVLPSMTKGEAARARADRIAGETSGPLTKSKQANIDKVEKIVRVVSGEEAPVTASEAIQEMQNRIRTSYADDVAKSEALGEQISDIYKGKQAAKEQALQSELDSEMAGVRLPRDYNPELEANNFRNVVLDQKREIESLSSQNFEVALEKIGNVSTPARRLRDRLDNTVDALEGIKSKDTLISGLSASKVAQLDRGVTKLDEMVDAGEAIPFRSLHNLKKLLDEASGYEAISPSENQIAAKKAASKVRDLLSDLAEESGAKGKAYKKANTFYMERILPFRTSQIAPLIASDVAKGTFKMTGESLAKKAVSDPETVRQILRSIESVPKKVRGIKAPIKRQLKNMYLNSLGGKIENANPRITAQLFDSPTRDSIERIKSLKSKLNVSDDAVNQSDINAMVNALSGKARKEAEDALKQKIITEDRISKNIKANRLIEKIANGSVPIPSDPRSFSREVLNENPEVAKAFVEKLDKFDPTAAADFRQGVTSEFKQKIKFGGEGSQRTSLNADEVGLWKPGSVEKFLSTKEGLKYRQVMGDEWAKNWIDLDRALKGSQIQQGVSIKEQVRAVFTTGSGLLVVAAGLPKWVYSKSMNALMGSNLSKPFLKNVEADPAYMQNLIPYLLGTSQGIEALMLEAKEDPDYAEWLENEIARRTGE